MFRISPQIIGRLRLKSWDKSIFTQVSSQFLVHFESRIFELSSCYLYSFQLYKLINLIQLCEHRDDKRSISSSWLCLRMLIIIICTLLSCKYNLILTVYIYVYSRTILCIHMRYLRNFRRGLNIGNSNIQIKQSTLLSSLPAHAIASLFNLSSTSSMLP